MGSPTVNNGYLYAIAGILELIRGAKLKEEGRGFGSYGWSGEAVKLMNEELTKAGFQVVDDGFRTTCSGRGCACQTAGIGPPLSASCKRKDGLYACMRAPDRLLPQGGAFMYSPICRHMV